LKAVGQQPVRLNPAKRLFWRSQPLNQQTGGDIFAALFQPQTAQPGEDGIACLLESPYPSNPKTETAAMSRYSICAGAPRTVAGQAQCWTPPLGEILPFIEALAQQPPPFAQAVPNDVYGDRLSGALAESLADSPGDMPLLPDAQLPFLGGWLGWLGYDCAWEIERLPWLKDDTLPFPVAFWYEPAEFALLDHGRQQLWLVAETAEQVAQLSERLAAAQTATPSDQISNSGSDSSTYSLYIYRENYRERSLEGLPTDGETASSTNSDRIAPSSTYDLRFESDRSAFIAAVNQAKAHIAAGDVFQVNHSLRFSAQTHLPSWQVYQTLHRINPSPFASYWHTPWGAVVSCSPERLVTLDSGIAQTRPIAGTRPRGQTAAEDDAIARELRGDRKEQAEHIMLVDLARNDLGRVCEWGSVQVAELMTIERYSHVMHLVSNVIGKLGTASLAPTSPAQLVAALFPGGTITGCPKVRCMEIIEALEPVRRSLFYGSCGYWDRRGRLDLNILIRTLLMVPSAVGAGTGESPSEQSTLEPAHTVYGQVGAGIVADSEPQREWQESLQKAKAQLLALGL
jgi:para-aminobenzoate synthetase component I